MKKLSSVFCVLFLVFPFIIFSVSTSFATAISITNRTGGFGYVASDYVLGTPDPIPFTLIGDNYNDGVLYLWDEVQNYTLTGNLSVDRVADPSASYIGGTSGNYFITEGTIVSSHYIQWDPIWGRVGARLNFDSDIFALITSDQHLADSDHLGLPGVDYGDFILRGLEPGDTTDFNGGSVDIDWFAAYPGDWTRLITTYSPGGDPAPVPEPATIFLLGTGLIGLVGFSRKKSQKK